MAEFVSGALTALGFLGPVVPVLIISVMLVAIVSVHWSRGFWNIADGNEFPLVNAAVALTLA